MFVVKEEVNVCRCDVLVFVYVQIRKDANEILYVLHTRCREESEKEQAIGIRQAGSKRRTHTLPNRTHSNTFSKASAHCMV